MTLFRALSHKKNMFGLFLLFSSQHYLRLSWTFPCLFPFYLQKKALSRLLTISLGFFYRSRTKKAFCICLHLITLMLAYFTQTNVLVSLQLNWVPLSFISHNTKFILFCCSALSFPEQRCFGHELRLLKLYSPWNSFCLLGAGWRMGNENHPSDE